MTRERSQARRSHRARVQEGRRGVPPDGMGVAGLHPRAVPGQLPPRPHPPLPAFHAGAPRVRRVLREVREVPSGRRGLDAHRCHRGVPARGARGAAAARGLRDEDPQEVRRARIHERRVRKGDAPPRQRRRQRLCAALGPPVDRRASAPEALRDRGAEEEVPAEVRGRRDLGLRPHRAERRLRSGPGRDHSGQDSRRATRTS